MTKNEKHIETIETILFTAATNGASLVQEIHMPALKAAVAALRRTAEDDKAREEGLLVRLPAPYEADVWVPYHTGILHGNVAMYEHMPQGLFVRVRFAPQDVDTLPIATVRFTRQEAEDSLKKAGE